MSDTKTTLPVSGSKLVFFFSSLASLIRCCFKKNCRMFCVFVGTTPYEAIKEVSEQTGLSFEDATCTLLLDGIDLYLDSSDEEVSSDGQ